MDAEPVFAADRLFLNHVKLHEGNMAEHAFCEIARDAPDSADGAVKAEKADIAFGRAVKLADMRNVEPRQKFFPDIRAQSVSESGPDLVCLFLGVLWRVDEIAAQLANIDNRSHPLIRGIIPEMTG